MVCRLIGLSIGLSSFTWQVERIGFRRRMFRWSGILESMVPPLLLLCLPLRRSRPVRFRLSVGSGAGAFGGILPRAKALPGSKRRIFGTKNTKPPKLAQNSCWRMFLFPKIRVESQLWHGCLSRIVWRVSSPRPIERRKP